MLKLRIILLSNKLYYFIFILSLLFCIYKTYIIKYNSIYTNETNITGNIIEYSFDGDKLSLIINAKEHIKSTYYIKSIEELNYLKDNIKYGTKIKVLGELSNPKDNTIPNTFNYKKYLYNKRIYKLFNINDIKIINKPKNIIYILKNSIKKRIDKIDTKGYINTFILGDKTNIMDEVSKSYQKNSVTHLFAISGMHLGLFSSIILLLLKKLKVNEDKRYYITIIFLFIYSLLTGFPASVLRAFIFFTLITLNKIYYTNIKTINLLLLTISIIIFINPFIIYDIGFLYSCTTTFALVLLSNNLNSNNIIVTLFKVTIIANLFSLPITINNFYSINLLGILANIIIVPLVSSIIYPLSILVLLIPLLNPILNILLSILEYISIFLSKIDYLTIIIPKLPIILIIIYYIILYLYYKYNNKVLILIVILLIINKNYHYLDNNNYVYTIDVNQGDSSLIITSYYKDIILIDTGGKLGTKKEPWQERKKEYHSSDTIISFLHSIGINKITKLILTHGDADHMGESINLVNNIDIKEVILNNGSYNYLEKDLINILNQKHIKYTSNPNKIVLKNITLDVLQTKDFNNENDNSLVISTTISNTKFMFMGDASIKTEEEILSKYNLDKIDFLKVGHHGSDTSSKKEFINTIKPTNCLISVGENNKYNHPKESVINLLNNYCDIYRTDLLGTIKITINKNKYIINSIH